jgi:hypothetical protein
MKDYFIFPCLAGQHQQKALAGLISKTTTQQLKYHRMHLSNVCQGSTAQAVRILRQKHQKKNKK